LTETFLGGFVALHLYRYTGPNYSLSNLWGYGLYFTNSRLIGVQYTRYLSRAYFLGYVLLLVGAVALVTSLVWANLTNSAYVPWWAGAIVVGSFVASGVFITYLSPRRASNQIEREAPNSLLEIENWPKDLVLDRNDISQITVSGRIIVRGGIGRGRIVVVTKTGQRHKFVNTLDKKRLGRLIDLLQEFCSEPPPISLTYR